MKRIFLLALVLRLIGIFIFRNIDNYDLQSYSQVGELTFKNINIYPKIASLHHPYFPVFLYIEAFAFWLERLGGFGRLGVIAILKVIISFFDLGNLIFVYLLSNKNLKAAFLYAINPVSVLIFTLHGQFDAIPLFFLLFTFYLVTLRVTKHKKLWTPLGCLLFSIAVMVKTWPLLFIITLYKRLKNKKLILLILVFPLLSIIIYTLLFKASFIDIGKTLVSYQGLWGLWGIWGLLGSWRLRWQKLSTLIFLLVFFIYSLFKKEKNIIKEILGLLFFFFIFTTNFSIQYFSWIMPFLAIIKPKKYWLITLAITSYLCLSYLSWIFPTAFTHRSLGEGGLTISGLLLWFFLAWFFWMAYRKKKLV